MYAPDIINNIYDVFKEYYGEDKVDLQKNNSPFSNDTFYSIIVHWPEVVVTNEYDESITIWHLFAQIQINPYGRLMDNPKFNRSEYNEIQWNSDYAHSHLNGINKSSITHWRKSCLGEGPINNTIAKLRASHWTEYQGNNRIDHDYENQSLYLDMQVWQLFCWELDKYVHIESLEGGPYRRLKNVGMFNGRSNNYDCILVNTVMPVTKYTVLTQKFVKYLLSSNILEFSYSNGTYTIGWSFTDIILKISNCFIDWFNKSINNQLRKEYTKTIMLRDDYLKEAFIGNDSLIFKTEAASSNNILSYLGIEVLKFKGKPVYFTINKCNLLSVNPYLILNPNVIGYILYKILRFLNTYYGKEIQIQKTKSSDSSIWELHTSVNNPNTSITAGEETKDTNGEKARMF